MQLKIMVGNIENLKTTTELKEEKNKSGEVIDRRLVTKVQFEADIRAEDLKDVHLLLASESPVYAFFGSPQAMMELVDKKTGEVVAAKV